MPCTEKADCSNEVLHFGFDSSCSSSSSPWTHSPESNYALTHSRPVGLADLNIYASASTEKI